MIQENAAINFIIGNVVLVAGFAVIIVVLFATCAAVAFMIGLKIKHNKLRQRLRKHGISESKWESTSSYKCTYLLIVKLIFACQHNIKKSQNLKKLVEVFAGEKIGAVVA